MCNSSGTMRTIGPKHVVSGHYERFCCRRHLTVLLMIPIYDFAELALLNDLIIEFRPSSGSCESRAWKSCERMKVEPIDDKANRIHAVATKGNCSSQDYRHCHSRMLTSS